MTKGGTEGEGETETETETEAMASSRPQNVGILAMDVYFPASCITQVRMPPHMVGIGIGEEHSEFATILLFGYCVCFFGFVVFLFFSHFLVWGREVYAGHR